MHTMNVKMVSDLPWVDLFRSIEAELAQIHQRGPRERLPKEEQLRSHAYRWLLGQGASLVRVEAGYMDPNDPGTHSEADIVATFPGGELWLELKRGNADHPGFQAKPQEGLRAWKADVRKLCDLAPTGASKAFLLVGIRERGSRGRLYAEAQRAEVTGELPSEQRADQPLCHDGRVSWRSEIPDAELVFRLWRWT